MPSSAIKDVGTALAFDDIGARIADDGVGQPIARAVDRCRTRQCQVLDIAQDLTGKIKACRRLHQVGARARASHR